MLEAYWGALLAVISISIVMVVSPGQDFAMITRNSILYSRRAGLLGAVGISLAIWLHVMYSLAGIAMIISQSEWLFSLIKYAGASYLAYLGVRALMYRRGSDTSAAIGRSDKRISDFDAFKAGFISNALNPKTTLFFLSIFTQVVTPETPVLIQLLYGAIISVAHLIWFVLVAMVLSSRAIISKVDQFKLWIERVMGTVLCLLAGKLLLSE